MYRVTFLLIAFCLCACCRAQNPDLERLLHKYRSNPAIVCDNMMESFPEAKNVKVAETLTFEDSAYLVRHFVEEYNKIKGYKKLKATKLLGYNGSLLMRMMLNKAVTIRQWTGDDGYKDTVMEFDGCIYAIIHLGGFYTDDDLTKYIVIQSVPRQKHKHSASQAPCCSLTY